MRFLVFDRNAVSVQFVPGMRFLVFDFGKQARTRPFRSTCARPRTRHVTRCGCARYRVQPCTLSTPPDGRAHVSARVLRKRCARYKAHVKHVVAVSPYGARYRMLSHVIAHQQCRMTADSR
eukprot:2980905-Rhodomonas_salina.1